MNKQASNGIDNASGEINGCSEEEELHRSQKSGQMGWKWERLKDEGIQWGICLGPAQSRPNQMMKRCRDVCLSFFLSLGLGSRNRLHFSLSWSLRLWVKS